MNEKELQELSVAVSKVAGDLGVTSADLKTIYFALFDAVSLAPHQASVSVTEIFDAIESDLPLDGEYESDARYSWPRRWETARLRLCPHGVHVEAEEPRT